MVIGLEVHCELKTRAKIFCGCSTAFGAEPNTQCCPVCMGLPGSLPVLNRQVVEYAVMAGLATGCEIARYSKMDRKNYFYPDLPKAYQISQYDLPLCRNGYLDIETEAGSRRIGITRIHIEEDAGKLLHLEGGGTLCDYNRCGVPLIEIVSEPDIRSAEEAKAYVRKLRAVLLYTGVSDCRMQEGSLRCDVNLSVRKKGERAFGTRTEMKNLNAFQFIAKAIEYEFRRQVETLESGGRIVQETRRFDQASGKTFSMRSKENADDYRYFPDPDLPPIVLEEADIERLRAAIPPLPDQRKQEYIARYGLTAREAEQLTADRAVADYFEAAAAASAHPRQVVNLLFTEVFRLRTSDEEPIAIAPARLGRLADLLAEERIHAGTAKKLVARLWEKDGDPDRLIEEGRLWQISDEASLLPAVRKTLDAQPAAAADYRRGKTQALQQLIGLTIRESGGQGNPRVIAVLLQRLLTESE
ncbi:MAG: Asp-tRNA(Asn)/Glu-tRNA(Gln) amidotransferase subunit GatB [Clostridiales bacterium]|nr:Asp-tRNA(Asn)/Glu-tRNA(Gln) amidotransferase subunit GatB [Clostridiales bacterium]